MANPTQAELEVLNILWELGEARVQEVHDLLNRNRTVGYTTTLKIMQVMAQKGLLQRRLDGRSHVYSPAIQESATKSTLLSRFVESTFGGSKSRLVMQLLGNNKVSKDEIREIKEFLKQIEDE